MATITDLPYDLLYHIIFLLVQSSVGPTDFARITSSCKKFLLIAEDEHILKLVNFDIRLELKNTCQYQHVNGLLVKCSEAGNVAARFLLGKVILVSSSQLFLREWQKAECDVHPGDHLTLRALGNILGTNVHAQNCECDSFMTYFLPEQVSTGGSSQTRLVHYQLVKLVLLDGSHHVLAGLSVYFKTYISQFTSVSKEGPFLFKSITALVSHAEMIEDFEYQLANDSSILEDGPSNAYYINLIGRAGMGLAKLRALALRLFELHFE